MTEILNLGATPLANALLSAAELGQPEPRFPLGLAFCPECALVQLTETVPPAKLFRDYPYLSSCSDTMLTHVRILAELQADARITIADRPSRPSFP